MVSIAIVIIIVIVAAALIVIVIIEVVIIVTPKTLKESSVELIGDELSPVPIEKLAAISQHGIRQHHYSTCCCKEYDKSSGGVLW